MPSISDSQYNEPRALATLQRLVSTTAGILVNTYSYNDVKRVVSIDSDDESVEASSDDPLGEVIVQGLERLSFTEARLECARPSRGHEAVIEIGSR